MPTHLHSPHLQLSLHPEQGCWDVCGRQLNSPMLIHARARVHYRRGSARLATLAQWDKEQISSPSNIDTRHGPAQGISLSSLPDGSLLHCQLDFALPEAHPLLLWRIRIENRGAQPIALAELELLNAVRSMRFAQAASNAMAPAELAFFSNGWQSWSYTGAYGMAQRTKRTLLGPLNSQMWYNAGTPRPRRRGLFSSDMFGVLGHRGLRRGILVGFLSQRNHFGAVEASLDPLHPALHLQADGDGARLDPGAQVETDWACLAFVDLDAPDPLGVYLEAVARENQIAFVENAPQAGWCSWYHFFQGVTAEAVRQNLQSAAELRPRLPLELIQIDDGFQSQVGDWQSFSPRFPQGVAPLSAQIRQAGFTPGLWLAPFIVHPKSKVYAQHPEWLLRNRLGRPVNAGFIWDSLTAALDLTHPQALAYACQAVQTAAHEWGFPFLKLDFLYAAALPGKRHDPTRTRAQALRAGLEGLRTAAGPEATLLGCGCPLGSALGLVQAMRIGADVAPSWRPQWRGISLPFREEWAMPSVRNAMQNALTRAPMHRRWWLNDPDCLLLRPETSLSLNEVHSQATVIALTGGLTLISDHLPDLPLERLRIAQALLPPIGKAARALDWLDQPTPSLLLLDLHGPTGNWALLAAFNWADRPASRTLRLPGLLPAQGMAREFWSGQCMHLAGGEIHLPEIPAHGVRLLALQPKLPGEPQYLGGSLHISQGLEVRAWQPRPGGVNLRLERPGPAQGEIALALPQPPRSARLNDLPLDWQNGSAAGVYQFSVAFNQEAEIEIRW